MTIRQKLIYSMVLFFSTTVLAGADQSERESQLEAELKRAKIKINELEEELFIATDGREMKESEAALELAEGIYPWTDYMRRTTTGILFPHTATSKKGRVFGRFSHVSQNQSFVKATHPWNDLMGLESNVKVGIMIGYGILDNWDVSFQRTNGRDFPSISGTEYYSYDLYDIMTKVKVLDEFEHFVDLSVSGGATCFWQSNDVTEFSANAAILVEKSLWRFRFGSGLLYSSLSSFEQTNTAQDNAAGEKLYINEFDYTIYTGESRPAKHTTAIPFSIAMALTKNLSLFGEAAFPVSGYETERGPSAAAGVRITTLSHSYSLFLSNTSNNSFNSTFTGGYKRDRMDVFGFDIAIYF